MTGARSPAADGSATGFDLETSRYAVTSDLETSIAAKVTALVCRTIAGENSHCASRRWAYPGMPTIHAT
jgi:hypothetical protein